MIDKIKTDYKQYGFWGFGKRVFKFLLRKIGVEFNSYYYMIKQVDIENQRKLLEKTSISKVKELTYEDFLLGDKNEFTKYKLDVIRKRLEKGSFYPYGMIKEGRLVYSCWVSLKEFETSHSCLKGALDQGQALLLDDYCSPKERGQGIHTALNVYRLWKIAQFGKDCAVVIILKENIPAFKSQIKVGFKIAFTYYVASIWGISYTNFFERKRLFKESNK